MFMFLVFIALYHLGNENKIFSTKISFLGFRIFFEAEQGGGKNCYACSLFLSFLKVNSPKLPLLNSRV